MLFEKLPCIDMYIQTTLAPEAPESFDVWVTAAYRWLILWLYESLV